MLKKVNHPLDYYGLLALLPVILTECFVCPYHIIKLFSAMEWVLRLDELPGKMLGPTLVHVLKRSPNSLNKIHLLSTCSALGTGHRGK